MGIGNEAATIKNWIRLAAMSMDVSLKLMILTGIGILDDDDYDDVGHDDDDNDEHWEKKEDEDRVKLAGRTGDVKGTTRRNKTRKNKKRHGKQEIKQNKNKETPLRE